MSQELVFDDRTSALKNVAWWLYIFHAIGFFFSLGLLSVVPLIVNYAKRGEAADTFVYSHHTWQIRSFWWFIFWMAVGWLCFATIIGILLAIPIWVGAWLWKAYRLIRGWIDLNDNKPMAV